MTWNGDLVNPKTAAKRAAADTAEAVWDTDDYKNGTTIVVTGDGATKVFGAVLTSAATTTSPVQSS